jgi:hypothetical protein
LEKLEAVLAARKDMCVLARTDAAGDEIFRRVEAFSKTSADALLIDGVRSQAGQVPEAPELFARAGGSMLPPYRVCMGVNCIALELCDK